jgi:hypothetical protein
MLSVAGMHKSSEKASGFIVIDDPITKQQAISPEAIERARSLFDATIRNRLVQRRRIQPSAK